MASLKGVQITRDQVLRAFHEFSIEAHEKDWLAYKTQLYVVMHEGQPYPPKRILSIASGIPVRKFHGGAEANGVLTSLGFEVLPKTALAGTRPTAD